MTDCTIDVEVQSATSIEAQISTPTSLSAAVDSPTTITAAVTLASTIAAAITSAGTLSAAVSLPTSIEAEVLEPDALTASVVDYRQMELEFLETMELRAEADHRQVRKLSQTVLSTTIDTLPVKLPSSLLLFPTCKDCGYLEWTISASHADMSGLSVVFEMYASPWWNGSSYEDDKLIKTWTSPAFAAGAGNLNFDMKLQLKFQGPLTQATWAQMSWRDGAGVENILPFTGRTSPTINTGDVLNGHDGDVEVYLVAYISGAGSTFKIRTYNCLQYGIRSGLA